MTLPASWSLVTISCTYTNRDGTPAEGYVTFDSQQQVTIGGHIIVPKTILARLDGTGSIEVELPSTNDPDLSVTGWAYRVTEHIRDGRAPFYLEVPYDAGSIDLASASPATPAPVQMVTGLTTSDIGVRVASQSAVDTAQTTAEAAQTTADAALDAAEAAGASTACVWEAANSGGSYAQRAILTNSRLTALDTIAGVHGHLKATKPCLTGKRYFEVRVDVMGASGLPTIGVVQMACSSSQVGDNNTVNTSRVASWGLLANNGNKYHSASAAYGSALIATDVAMVAVDRAANAIWWGKNGTWFAAGDPATAAGAAYTDLEDWLFPAVSLGDGAKVTANFAGPFTYTLPSGFSAWDDGGDPS